LPLAPVTGESRVATGLGPRVWTTPWLSRTTANTMDRGSRIYKVIRVRSTQKLPRLVALRRRMPLASAAMTAMPLAAEVKFSTARPSIWVRWLMVVSPV
jgi:hypothetical protein